ncbi:MAG: CDP-diacylglycerol--serine O-phosphatidyltransferase [Magnetococcales bacterium]|nr:CDP-diacylglycerol--serine O-phosphatidyltransferase [Magnetococcales bacterium]MBF0583403.1 CDP-diacylglycerol--serine O-phosphatidyltransferase [Magnetococcales bacterium]
MSELINKRGVYIFPNLLTTGGMFFGFYAIMAALGKDYERSAQAIVAAGVFDALDGRVARAMNAASAFGKEYDSLADFLSFGIAPAVLVYLWALEPFHRLGWAAAFLYAVCGALRLARFNVQQHVIQDERVSKRYFQGLPIPAAAIIVSAIILFYQELGIHAEGGSTVGLWRWLPLMLTFMLGILMVSTIRFRSMKDFHWHRKRPFLTLVGAVVFIAVLTIQMASTLFLMSVAYLLSALHSHREYLRLLAEGKEVEEDEVQDLTV